MAYFWDDDIYQSAVRNDTVFASMYSPSWAKHVMVRLCLLVGFPALFCSILSRAQRTIHVPADMPSIQAGINAADDGDTVLVAPGTYYEHLDFLQHAITVTSSDGPSKTILDGQNTGPVAVFKSYSYNSTVLSGFTILHGGDPNVKGSDSMGAVIIGGGDYDVSGTVQNNIFEQSNCMAVNVLDGSPRILNNTIRDTLGPSSCFLDGGTPIRIEGTIDRRNGNMLPTEIAGNTIENNLQAGGLTQFPESSGGITLIGAGALIHDNIIRNNRTQAAGGAISAEQYYLYSAIYNNLIYGNYAARGGGGIYLVQADDQDDRVAFLVTNNTLADNTSGNMLDAYYATNGSQIGVRTLVSSSATLLVNNVVRGSTAAPLIDCTAPPTLFVNSHHELSIDHTLFFNTTGSAVFGSNCVDRTAYNDNLVADPVFVDAASGNFQLGAASPAVDSGTDSIKVLTGVPTLLGSTPTPQYATDLSGSNRVQDATGKGYSIIDRGAYERAGTASQQGTTIALSLPTLVRTCTAVTLTANLTFPSSVPDGTVQFFDDGVLLGSSAIGAGGVASYTTPLLQSAFHEYRASYAGDLTFSPGVSVIFAPYVLPGFTCLKPVTLTLGSSLNPAPLNTNITFTTTISSAAGTPSGSIVFSDGGRQLASVPITNGAASLQIGSLTRGTHSITATFAGDQTYNAGQAAITQAVVGVASTTVVTVSATSVFAGMPVSLRASTSIQGGTVPVSSAIHIFDNGQPLSGLNVAADGSVFISVQLSAGVHSITATYDGDTVAEPSRSSTISFRVDANATMTVLRIDPLQAVAFRAVSVSASVTTSTTTATPAGSVTFQGVPGMPIALSGSGIAAANISLPAGTYQVVASYAPADISFLASTSAPQTLTIAKAPTVTGFVSLPAPTYQFRSVTLTAVVHEGTGRHLATGSAALLIDGASSDSRTLAADGTVTFSTSTLSPGDHAIVVTYSGDNNFLPSSSVVGVVTVLPSDFSLSTTDTISLPAEHHHTATIQVASLGAFSGFVALACANLPAHATCTFGQDRLMLAQGASASTTVIIDTSDVLQFKPEASLKLLPSRPIFWATFVGWPALFLLKRRRGPFLFALWLTFILAGSSVLTGCSAKYPDHTAPGTYDVTLTGVSATAQHTQTIHFTVTP